MMERPLSNIHSTYKDGRCNDGGETLYGGLTIFFAIKGAFDRTNYDVIGKFMSRRGFYQSIIDWKQVLLAGLSLKAHQNSTLSMFSSRTAGGYSQSGVIFPLIYCVVVNEQLKTFQSNELFVYGHVEKVAIIARREFLNVLRDRMSYVLDECGAAIRNCQLILKKRSP